MQWSIKNTSDPVRIDLILFDQFSNYCLANCIEPLRAANTISGRTLFVWNFYTIDNLPVQSSSGLPIVPSGSANQVEKGGLLYVISSYRHQAHNTRQTRALLQRLATRSKAVFGFDTGPWLMAAAGLLNSNHATIHWDVLVNFAESFDQVECSKARFIWDDDRMTCAGGSAAFDMTLEMIKQMFGAALMLDVKALFQMDGREQHRPDVSISGQARRVMDGNLENPLSNAQLSKELNISSKQLLRRIKSETGLTPDQLYRHARISGARKLIAETALSISEISLRCGYENASAMGRAFKTRFELSPRSYRQKVRQAEGSVRIVR